jgi:hypothetical protein
MTFTFNPKEETIMSCIVRGVDSGHSLYLNMYDINKHHAGYEKYRLAGANLVCFQDNVKDLNSVSVSLMLLLKRCDGDKMNE